MKRILVTGGAGFIGSHLCVRLLNEGCQVVCLDNFLTGSPKNIQHLTANPNFQMAEQDITTPYCPDGPIDEIYNLACPASPIHYQYNPIKTLKTNVLGAINMLDLAIKKRSKLLQASTSEVYGDPAVHPQPETYWGNVNPIGPRSCYDEGKRCAETLCMDYYRQYRIPIKIVRIFNTYGPNMCLNDGRVISNFTIQALMNQDITVYGDGSQTRSFLYIDDLVEGLVRTMATDDDFTGPVNLGNPREFTIRQLATLVLEITRSKASVILKPLPADDPQRRKPDITTAQENLGWSPTILLEQGLVKMMKYFKENHYDENILIVGYQPSIISNLTANMKNVRVLDLNPDNIGYEKCGAIIEDGERAMKGAVEWADVILCTGSTVCNGTLVDYLDTGKKTYFFGTTLAGTAKLLDLDRLCFADIV